MTNQEKSNKKEAKRLINLPVSQRPANVYYKPATRFDFDKYMVQFGETGVFFLHDGKRLQYLGEYPASNWRP